MLFPIIRVTASIVRSFVRYSNWATATVAEVQLLKGAYARAAELYETAVLIERESIGSHETSWRQAQFLMDKLGTPLDERRRIAKVFRHLTPKGICQTKEAEPGANRFAPTPDDFSDKVS